MYKTAIQSVLTSLLTAALGFLYSVVIARVLGPENRGVLATIVLISTFLANLSQFGLANGFVYYKRLTHKKGFILILNSLIVILLTSTFLSLLIFDYLKLMNLFEVRNLIVLSVILISIHSYCQEAIQIEERLFVLNTSKLFIPIFNLTALFFFTRYYSDANVEDVTLINLSSFVLVSIYSLFFLYRYEFSSLGHTYLRIKDVAEYSVKLYGIKIVGILISNFDKVLILLIADFKVLGLYSVAFGTSRLIGIIPHAVSTVLYSKYAGKGDDKSLSLMVNSVFSILFIPLLIITLILSILSIWFLPFIFGIEYEDAVIPFCILLFECVIAGMGWVLAQRFTASGKPGLIFVRQLISIIPLVIIYIIANTENFMIALSLAMLFSSVIRLSITLILYKKVLNEPAPVIYPTVQNFTNIKNNI